jgi:Cobinamide kinase / cobinamide phosphate guanyltransferase
MVDKPLIGVLLLYRLGRLYRDTLGCVNQCLAQAADRAYLMVAGMAVDSKRLHEEASLAVGRLVSDSFDSANGRCIYYMQENYPSLLFSLGGLYQRIRQIGKSVQIRRSRATVTGEQLILS